MNNDSNTMWHRWMSPRLLLLYTVVVSSGVLQWYGANQWLSFQREQITSGAWWLLLSGNAVHLGWSHWSMNIAGLLVISTLVGFHFNAWQWLLIGLVSGLGVGAGLYQWMPELSWYVGLSGVLHGLLLAGCWPELRTQWGYGLVLLGIVGGKLAWEQLAGPLPGSEAVAGGNVIVDAHFYGGIAGGAAGAALMWWPRSHSYSPAISPSVTGPSAMGPSATGDKTPG